jgi:uncharacterized membrane protein YphA (DoxX/SURF4 family)
MLGRITPTYSTWLSPRWVSAVLEHPATWFCARVALVCAYLIGGLTKLFDLPGAVAEQAHFGLHPPEVWAAVAIVVEIVGSLLIIWGRLVWFAGGALAVLTAIASLVAEDFWKMQGHARFVAMNSLLEHIGLIGAFAMAAMIVNARQRSQKPAPRATSFQGRRP